MSEYSEKYLSEEQIDQMVDSIRYLLEHDYHMDNGKLMNASFISAAIQSLQLQQRSDAVPQLYCIQGGKRNN